MEYVRLYNVIDTRSGTHYSEVVVKARNARWFIPAEEADE